MRLLSTGAGSRGSTGVRPLPPRTRSLLQLCGVLAAGRPLPPRNGWDTVDWGPVTRLATDLLLAPALWTAVARARLGPVVPPPLAEQLKVAHRRNTVRNVALRAQLAEAVGALNSAGIVPLLFKGSLYLVDGTFRDHGERFQWDLDLAVAPQESTPATVALGALGYRPAPSKPSRYRHELSLVRGGDVAPLELHASLGEPPIPRALPIGLVVRGARSIDVGGARAAGLSATHAAIHNVLHAQVQDMNHSVAGIPVRQLHTLTRLIEAHDEAIDWDAVRWGFTEPALSRVLSAYVYQAETLFAAPAPPGIRCGTGALMHHLWCLAFWELGWPADALRNLRYAFGREYLAATYERSGQGRRLVSLRTRHAYRLVRDRGRGVLSEVTMRRA